MVEQEKTKKKPKKSSKGKKASGKTSRPALKAEKGLPKEERFKERWNALNSDVHSALSNWNDLTEKFQGKLSREDQQLLEIKKLLKDLQDKLKIFND